MSRRTLACWSVAAGLLAGASPSVVAQNPVLFPAAPPAAPKPAPRPAPYQPATAVPVAAPKPIPAGYATRPIPLPTPAPPVAAPVVAAPVPPTPVVAPPAAPVVPVAAPVVPVAAVQPAAPPRSEAAKVVWKRAGTTLPSEALAPAVVPAAAEVQQLELPPVVPVLPVPTPELPTADPAPVNGEATVKPVTVQPAAPVPGAIKQGIPFAPVVWKGKNDPTTGPRATPGHSRLNFMPKPLPPIKARGQTPGGPTAGTAGDPAAPGGIPGAVPTGAGAPPPGWTIPATPPPPAAPAAPKPPAKYHGHKYPVQPFAPPGAFPVPPTDAGYYTLKAMVEGEEQEKPPRWPYPRSGPIGPSFAEIDFSYLDAIDMEDRDWAEKLHRVPVGDHWLMSTGGELRYRYNSESNTRLTGINDTYDLFRTRLYTDVWYEDLFRLYVEFYYGDTGFQDVVPYARDVNRGDFQQLFVDVKLGEWDKNPAYLRVGRQELLYGSQRLISTNDWGNNRPRFDGVKAFYRSEKLDADAFAVRPTIAKFDDLDTWDKNLAFSGVWATYKPKKGTFIDGYYLNLDNATPNVAKGQFRSGGANTSTLGSRFYSRFDSGLIVDVEGMLQFGHHADQTILAQAASAYLGWNFKDVWANPTVWAGYDYASGDPDPNNTGQHRTFNQLFQFGHYYYGFIDITGGQNIRDFNFQAYMYPAHWVTAGAQYHIFRLDSNKDAMYNSAGVPIRRDPTGKAGDDIGSELDLLLNFHLTDRQDIFLNYCHFFTGDFIRATGPAGKDVPLDYVYAQYTMRW